MYCPVLNVLANLVSPSSSSSSGSGGRKAQLRVNPIDDQPTQASRSKLFVLMKPGFLRGNIEEII